MAGVPSMPSQCRPQSHRPRDPCGSEYERRRPSLPVSVTIRRARFSFACCSMRLRITPFRRTISSRQSRISAMSSWSGLARLSGPVKHPIQLFSRVTRSVTASALSGLNPATFRRHRPSVPRLGVDKRQAVAAALGFVLHELAKRADAEPIRRWVHNLTPVIAADHEVRGLVRRLGHLGRPLLAWRVFNFPTYIAAPFFRVNRKALISCIDILKTPA